MWFKFLKNIFFTLVIFSSCTTPKGYQANKPFVYKTSIKLTGGNFTTDERKALEQRMYGLLDDSMKTRVKDFIFFFHWVQKPPVYDSGNAALSAKNLINTLTHLGYYRAKDTFMADTARLDVLHAGLIPPKFYRDKQQRVSVKFIIDAGPPTLIDTFYYRLRKPDLQELAAKTKAQSLLKPATPVTKANVLGETVRLMEIYRNNGYYRFTPDDLKVLGDTSIAALTNISDDHFENLRILAEANQQRNKPTIKLAMVLNPASDTSHLKKFYINNIYIQPDFNAADALNQPVAVDTVNGNIIQWYHKKIFKNQVLLNNLYFKKGNQYSQQEYMQTVNSFSRLGVWQNVTIEVKEVKSKDSMAKIDMVLQLVPAKKYGFEANVEASYSANSNTNNLTVANAGNLLGLSGNVSLQNRNLGRQGIKMTHAIRAGVELNLNAQRRSNQRINSSEVSYTNTVSIPKLVFPFGFLNRSDLVSKQSFVSASVSNTNRIALFKLNSLGFALGYEFNFKNYKTLTVKPLNIEYSNLYNRSADFDATLKDNPFLRYSFNTALVLGSTVGYTQSRITEKKTSIFKANFEESGALFYVLPAAPIKFLEKDLKNFLKLDVEKTITINKGLNAAFAFRFFAGIGLPVGKKDTTLPFFKQYFGGGANSMRGWPIRGIGPGIKALAPYESRFLNDRTGDFRYEINAEYRRHLFQIIPNTLALKWALFADIGNVWNLKNTQPGGGFDSTQLRSIKDLYKQMGVTLGTGFRLDFNYVVLRIDFGLRFKRPELTKNDGWKAPSIGFDDFFQKIFKRGDNNEYRIWRYENFNFTIGLNYPF